MNELHIVSDGVIGSTEAVKRLAELDKAKILVISDTHRNHELCLKTIMDYGETCDALFHLGDGVQDILYWIQRAFSDSTIQKKLPSVIFIVEGNLDPHQCSILKARFVSGMKKIDLVSLNFLSFLFVRVCRLKIMLTHGHLTNVKKDLAETARFAKVRGCSLCFFGHLHQRCDTIVEGVRMINPGCLMRSPKPEDDKGIAIFEVNARGVSYVRMIKYDKEQDTIKT